jgi:Flp pilus assembly pilin Flp
MHMLALFKRFCEDDRGATATEYAMLIIFIALAIAGGATLLGSNINAFVQQDRREHLEPDALSERSRRGNGAKFRLVVHSLREHGYAWDDA